MPIKQGTDARTAARATSGRRKPSSGTGGTSTPQRAVKAAPRPTAAQRQQAERAGREPSALSVEQVLISSILNHGEMHIAVSSGVTSEMFVGFSEEWKYLERTYAKHKKTPTIIVFRNRFPDFRIVKTADDTAHLSDEMVRIYTRSTMVDFMRNSLERLRNDDLEEATREISNALRAASTTVSVYERDIDLLHDYDDMWSEVSAIREQADANGGLAGIPWGFDTYDSRTGGAKPGEFIVVAARLGQGKSQVVNRWVVEALMHDKVVQLDSLEMSRAQVGMRVHSLLSSRLWTKTFNSEDLMLGKNVDLDDYRRFLDHLRKKVKGRLIISDGKRGRLSTEGIMRQIERNQPDIVYVDYIQLVRKRSNDWQGLGEVSGELAQIAQETGVPIVAASQLNRQNGLGREPAGPEALSGADAIGHDAHQIITMRQMSASTIVMQSQKNRHGRSGMKWHVEFRPGDGVIEQCTYDDYEKLREKDAQAEDDEAEEM